MLLVLFSDLQNTAPADRRSYYWDIVEETKNFLGHNASFLHRNDNVLGELSDAVDVLVVFPGLAENKKAIKRARELGIPVVKVTSNSYNEAMRALDKELTAIEQKKIL
jgi:hypothetical protein